jgi:hypothetical protein
MRDPARIPRILKKLEQLWNKVPDQRFWQVIVNMHGDLGNPQDPFYVEDDKFEKGLTELINKW